MLLKFARWIVTLNHVDSSFKNPACVFYSLENETPQKKDKNKVGKAISKCCSRGRL